MSRTKRSLGWFLPIFAIVAVIASTPNAVLGAITHWGDISPSELSSWTAATVGYIGTTGDQTYSAGTGTVEITGGTLNSNSCYLGYIANTSGTLTVDGTGSMLTNNYSLGHHGGLGIGLGGAGTLYVTNGGNISTESGGVFGISAGSTGAGTVTGDGSTWTIGSWLCVGSSGTGTISITNGGSVRSVSGAIGNSNGAAGTVTVDGNGSMWEVTTPSNSHGFRVGDAGKGVLNITGGGDVVITSGTRTASIGVGLSGATTGEGTVTVDGPGSTLTCGAGLWIGDNGTGVLDIVGGGSVTVTGVTSICKPTSARMNAGTISFNTGTLTTSSLYATAANLTGTGEINTRGLVSDVDLLFDSVATQTLTFTGIGKSITLNLDASNSSNVGDLGAGYTGAGTLVIRNRVTVNSAAGMLGCKVGSVGAGTVTGDGSHWISSGEMSIGRRGTGTLDITNGGSVRAASSYIGYNPTGSGTVTVDGSGSEWVNSGDLTVGNYGHAELHITNGGFVGNATGYVGRWLYLDTPEEGYVSVDGSGSKWANSGDLILSHRGTGELHISNGGTVSDVNGILVHSDNIYGYEAKVTVDGTGSTWTNSGFLAIGARSSSQVTLGITNGAAVSNVVGYISAGNGSATSSTVTVDGANSKWTNSGALYVGFGTNAKGRLNISNGGTVVAGTVTNAFAAGSTGTINFDGGTLKANATSTAWLTAGAGTSKVYIQGKGATFDTAGYDDTIAVPLLLGNVTAGGGVTKLGGGTLTLTGVNTYTGQTVVQAGVLELGTSSQGVVLAGSGADIQAGKMVFDYSGTVPDIGTLLDDSYGTGGGMDPWTTGQFRSTSADPEHGLGWVDNGTDKVTVMYTLYGDSNLDGSVNGADLNAVLSSYNLIGQVWAGGDFNYDGSVNGADLNTVLSNYNQSLPASTAAVPEPSTLLLIIAGLASLLAYAWRKRQ